MQNSSRFSICMIAVLCCSAAISPCSFAADGDRLFALKVLPLLKSKCLACHGDDAKKLKGGLDLRTRAGLLKGGESGKPAIIAKKPEESLLLQAIKWVGLEMPPKKNDRLTEAEIELVRQWIAEGAPWPDEAAVQEIRRDDWNTPSKDGIRIVTSGGLADEWTQRRYKPEDIWSFQPLRKPGDNRRSIDDFINGKLASAKLTPAGQAEPRLLIRRVTFDLHGLPPTPDETDVFLEAWQKNAEAAWRELVDRLLESPRYGEHWGQHWLDVVRYADTSGFSNDWERSNAWRYRDYVIRSLNADKPYDQFVREQLAGDERWEAVKPEDRNPEWLIATGFLRMGPWEHTAMTPDVVSRQAYLDDVVNSVGQTFLSTMLRCCKCHDHKFDPLPTRDYYRIYATFATTQPVEREADFLPSENREGFKQNREQVERLLKFARTDQARLVAKREAAARKWYADRDKKYVPYKERMNLPEDTKPPRHIGLSVADEGELKVREQDVRIWSRALDRYQPLVQGVFNSGDLNQNSERLRLPDPKKKLEVERAKRLPVSRILSGGSVFSPSDAVTPGTLSAISLSTTSGTEADPWALPAGMTGRRTGLANWITDPRNPLASRSIVNRVWGWHFGQGIAANPNNFGTTGKKPSHAELLDWLATRFVDEGWSLKKLHRSILQSEAYRRSTHHPESKAVRQIDPANQLLAVFTPRRISAEELRDGMLHVTGELNPEMGGLPIRPEINLEVALAPRMIQFSIAPAYQPSRTPDERNRRSIYAHRIRGLADPLLEVFNKPSADESCERRDVSNVTPQVFSLLNSEVATNRSIAFALRAEKSAKTPEARIEQAIRLAFGRPARAQELTLLSTHYREMLKYHAEHKPKPSKFPTRVTRSLVEEFSGEAFEYQEWLDIYEDYVPDRRAADVSAEVRALADVCLLLFNSNEFLYVY